MFNNSLTITGHLRIHEFIDGKSQLVFDNSNMIINEGRNAIMDWLASLGFTETYNIQPFGGIVLTRSDTAVSSGNTFLSVVSGKLSNEGVLHLPSAYCTVTHSQGSATVTITGTLPANAGFTPPNNYIKSVCVCMGLNPNSGGVGQGTYVPSNNERLFSRVVVGHLVKTYANSFTFEWVFTIGTA